MTTKKLTKLLALYLPYLLLGLVATNFGEAWRLAEGKELGDKIMSMMGTIPVAFANPLPSLHPLDLLIGFSCGAGLRLAVYLRSKNAKKYRHGMEYGSARWGTPKDIEPFMAPKFADNIILTKTERLMMSNRPPDPKNARNKNVLVVGGSGSGKTRFWLKPNLLQCHSSYVVTDPKGTIVLECGNVMLKNGYKVKILNTINFKKSMHYNPFAYVHSEKDILKLVTTLMTNTKGEGSGGDPFWDTGCAIVIIAHMNKMRDTNPLYRTNGSIDIAGAARSILAITRTANSANPAERYLVQVKSNLAPMGSAILFEVADKGVNFLDELEMTAEDAFAATAPRMGRPNDREEAATAFIRSLLDGGRQLASDCEAKLEGAGFKKSTYKKAKKKAGVHSVKDGFAWYWTLPEVEKPKESWQGENLPT